MKLDAWELLDLRLCRQNKPPTKAKESKYYRDPAQTVEFESEMKRRDEERRRKKAMK